MGYGEEKCVLCGKNYKPRSKKSWLCLDCYLNDYLPNKKKYSIFDFEQGIYSFITKRHIDNFYKSIEQIEEEKSKKVMSNEEIELQCQIDKFFEKPKITHSATPEEARKRMVNAYLDKITYVP